MSGAGGTYTMRRTLTEVPPGGNATGGAQSGGQTRGEQYVRCSVLCRLRVARGPERRSSTKRLEGRREAARTLEARRGRRKRDRRLRKKVDQTAGVRKEAGVQARRWVMGGVAGGGGGRVEARWADASAGRRRRGVAPDV